MEQLLLNRAAQLNSLDEASLTALWDKYARTVNAFEPTKKWEESVLVLSFIQAAHWKNQLFNAQWALRNKSNMSVDMNMAGTQEAFKGMIPDLLAPEPEEHHAEILQFEHRRKDEDGAEQ